MRKARPLEELAPDVSDGLTRLERVVLYQLHVRQTELGRPSVPTAMLYGRVVEHISISEAELVACLVKLGAGNHNRPR